MKKYLVLFYTKTGNSRFVAQKLSEYLSCECRQISAAVNNPPLVILLSMLKVNIRTNISKQMIAPYTDIVVIGPIWAGQLISPLRSVLTTCRRSKKDIHFALTCETTDEDRYKSFGYAKVLRQAKDIGGSFVKTTEAFSTALVNTDHKNWSPRLSQKIKITEANFHGPIKEKIQIFAKMICLLSGTTAARKQHLQKNK